MSISNLSLLAALCLFTTGTATMFAANQSSYESESVRVCERGMPAPSSKKGGDANATRIRVREPITAGVQHPAHNTGLNLIDRIALIESNNRPDAIGDHGSHQLSAAAWEDCNAVLRSRGFPTFPWSCATDIEVSRDYCAIYLGILERQFIRATGKPPTERQLLGVYRYGFKGGKRRGFQFGEAKR